MSIRAVIYTRYSSDMQRDASSEDQARNCRQYIERAGWLAGNHYKDEAISGSTSKRPGYQAMLTAAKRNEFDVLVLDKLSRFSRDLVEQETACNKLTHGQIRIVAVNDGYDSSVKGSKTMRQFNGAMNEKYLEDLADNVHRGLTGQALKKYWAGGRPYGYDLVQDTDPHRLDQYGKPLAIGTRLVPNKEKAKIVRRIFERYADGCSARAIAAELNLESIPSPGAKWNRRTRAKGQWLASAISGDPKRGIGILNNSLYHGVYRWNRTRWLKNPETDTKVCRSRPESEWIRHEASDETLRIVSDALWDRVKQRQARQSHSIGAAVARGIEAGRAKHTGRGPKYLLSGVMVCADCGRPMNMVSKLAYSCPAYHDGGPAACANGVLINRVVAEGKLLHGLKDLFLSAPNIEKLKRKVRRLLAERQASAGPERLELEGRLAEQDRIISNIVNSIASAHSLKGSSALAARLASAEVEKVRIETRLGQAPPADRRVIEMIPALVDRVEEIVGDFEARVYAAGGPAVARARTDLKQWFGTVPIKGELEGHKRVPYALLNGSPRLLLQAANAFRGNYGSGGRI